MDFTSPLTVGNLLSPSLPSRSPLVCYNDVIRRDKGGRYAPFDVRARNQGGIKIIPERQSASGDNFYGRRGSILVFSGEIKHRRLHNTEGVKLILISEALSARAPEGRSAIGKP